MALIRGTIRDNKLSHFKKKCIHFARETFTDRMNILSSTKYYHSRNLHHRIAIIVIIVVIIDIPLFSVQMVLMLGASVQKWPLSILT